MTDKPKTIQEALAEVQRNVNEAYSPPFERDPSGGFRKKPQLDTSKPGGKIPDVKLAPEAPAATPKAPTAPKEPFFTPGKGVKSIGKNIVAPIAKGAFYGAAISQGAKELATGTETGRAIGKWTGKLPGAQDAAQAMVRGREKVADTLGDVPGVGQSLKAGYQNLYKDSKFNAPSAPSADTTPKATPAPATTAVTKTETKPAETTTKATDKPVSVVKTKGGDYNVYAKGSEKAADFRKTYSAAKGNFEWEGRKYAKPSSETAKSATSTSTKPATSTAASYKPASPQTDKTYTHYADTGVVGVLPSLGNVKTPSVVGQNDISSFNSDERRSSDRQNFDDTRKPVGKFEDPTDASRYADAELAPAGKGGENYLKATIGTKEFNNRFGPKDQPESESGGKRKKMSEDTNPLIASFLALQEKNPANMFEAAKKLSKKQDEKLDVVDDDKIDAKDLAALRAGKKKVDEANIDPVVTGSSSVTKDPKKYVDPSTPKVPYSELPKPGNAAGDVLSKAKNALDKTGVKEETEEEVTFSQAEIDHINSFFLEASVAPNRPEVATGADSTSDKMSQNDVTGTAESGKRIRKEEIELDEKLTDEAKANIRTALSDKMKKTSGPARSLIKLAKTNPANVKEENLEEGFAKIVKGIKRSLKGWPAEPLHGSGGNKPKDVVKRTRERSDSDVKSLASDSNKAAEHSPAGLQKNVAKQEMKRRNLEEGRPKKNPEPETTERDPRKHIQVEAGRAAAGNVVDFTHNDGSKSKITPAMGRRITSHLNTLKPADRQAAVNKMHDSAEGLKV